MIAVVILGCSTTSFSNNVVVAETSHQLLQVLSFCDQERVKPPLIKITVVAFLVIKKYGEAFQGFYFLRIRY